jgi:hypothetical protein
MFSTNSDVFEKFEKLENDIEKIDDEILKSINKKVHFNKLFKFYKVIFI